MTPENLVYHCPYCGKSCPCGRKKSSSIEQPSDLSYRLISISKGQIAKVSTVDFAYLNQRTWSANWSKGSQAYYAHRSEKIDGKMRTIKMHRLIMGLVHGDGKVVDHINHDTLDNRRENLRVCTHKENMQNINPSKRSLSRTLSIRKSTRGTFFAGGPLGKFGARIRISGQYKHLGCADTEEEAHALYLRAVAELS